MAALPRLDPVRPRTHRPYGIGVGRIGMHHDGARPRQRVRQQTVGRDQVNAQHFFIHCLNRRDLVEPFEVGIHARHLHHALQAEDCGICIEWFAVVV
ncbi:hypothetical protein D3C72_1992540 [compost metagenome]